jgi:hypothetical protein
MKNNQPHFTDEEMNPIEIKGLAQVIQFIELKIECESSEAYAIAVLFTV